MLILLKSRKATISFKAISALIVAAFLISTVTAYLTKTSTTYASVVDYMPLPTELINTTPHYNPATIHGVRFYADNPFKIDFIIDEGNSRFSNADLKSETSRLIKYFLAALTISEDDLWVNLSPHEKDRITPEALGATDMGRDLLAEDYILKQLLSSLTYPDNPVGKRFWSKVYERAYQLYGTTEVPMDTFNKIWIMPDRAVVHEANNGAYLGERHLKVMLEEDYVAQKQNIVGVDPCVDPEQNNINHNGRTHRSAPTNNHNVNQLSAQIAKEVILPVIEEEINNGKNFSYLRQIYDALILATWFKERLRRSIQNSRLPKKYGGQAKFKIQNLLNKVYFDKNKVKGIEGEDPQIKEKIYSQYLEAYRKGVYNYVRRDFDQHLRKRINRRYHSGGAEMLGKHVRAAIVTKSGNSPKETARGDLSEASAVFNPVDDGKNEPWPRGHSGNAVDEHLENAAKGLTQRNGGISKTNLVNAKRLVALAIDMLRNVPMEQLDRTNYPLADMVTWPSQIIDLLLTLKKNNVLSKEAAEFLYLLGAGVNGKKLKDALVLLKAKKSVKTDLIGGLQKLRRELDIHFSDSEMWRSGVDAARNSKAEVIFERAGELFQSVLHDRNITFYSPLGYNLFVGYAEDLLDIFSVDFKMSSEFDINHKLTMVKDSVLFAAQESLLSSFETKLAAIKEKFKAEREGDSGDEKDKYQSILRQVSYLYRKIMVAHAIELDSAFALVAIDKYTETVNSIFVDVIPASKQIQGNVNSVRKTINMSLGHTRVSMHPYTGSGNTSIHKAVEDAQEMADKGQIDEARWLLIGLRTDLSSAYDKSDITILMDKWNKRYSGIGDLLIRDIPKTLDKVKQFIVVMEDLRKSEMTYDPNPWFAPLPYESLSYNFTYDVPIRFGSSGKLSGPIERSDPEKIAGIVYSALGELAQKSQLSANTLIGGLYRYVCNGRIESLPDESLILIRDLLLYYDSEVGLGKRDQALVTFVINGLSARSITLNGLVLAKPIKAGKIISGIGKLREDPDDPVRVEDSSGEPQIVGTLKLIDREGEVDLSLLEQRAIVCSDQAQMSELNASFEEVDKLIAKISSDSSRDFLNDVFETFKKSLPEYIFITNGEEGTGERKGFFEMAETSNGKKIATIDATLLNKHPIAFLHMMMEYVKDESCSALGHQESFSKMIYDFLGNDTGKRIFENYGVRMRRREQAGIYDENSYHYMAYALLEQELEEENRSLRQYLQNVQRDESHEITRRRLRHEAIAQRKAFEITSQGVKLKEYYADHSITEKMTLTQKQDWERISSMLNSEDPLRCAAGLRMIKELPKGMIKSLVDNPIDDVWAKVKDYFFDKNEFVRKRAMELLKVVDVNVFWQESGGPHEDILSNLNLDVVEDRRIAVDLIASLPMEQLEAMANLDDLHGVLKGETDLMRSQVAMPYDNLPIEYAVLSILKNLPRQKRKDLLIKDPRLGIAIERLKFQESKPLVKLVAQELLDLIRLENMVYPRLLKICAADGITGKLLEREEFRKQLNIKELADALGVSQDTVCQELADIAENIEGIVVVGRLTLYPNGPYGHACRGSYAYDGSLSDSAIWEGEQLFIHENFSGDKGDILIALKRLEEAKHVYAPDLYHPPHFKDPDPLRHNANLKALLDRTAKSLGESSPQTQGPYDIGASGEQNLEHQLREALKEFKKEITGYRTGRSGQSFTPSALQRRTTGIFRGARRIYEEKTKGLGLSVLENLNLLRQYQSDVNAIFYNELGAKDAEISLEENELEVLISEYEKRSDLPPHIKGGIDFNSIGPDLQIKGRGVHNFNSGNFGIDPKRFEGFSFQIIELKDIEDVENFLEMPLAA
ncbi:MAG: hypothetical protein GY858_09770 [Candidatus Omnitrophica bacterium]|nr:hypothetical protein [Candidatus Omnitrophota bacterium]